VKTRETLIHDHAWGRNFDSKSHSPGFDNFKIQFHSQFTETFSTASANSGHPAECLQRAPQVYSSQREEVSATSTNRDGAA
jgi:hypothetical protein